MDKAMNETEWASDDKRRRRRFSSERDTAGRIHKASVVVVGVHCLFSVPSSHRDSSQTIINKIQ